MPISVLICKRIQEGLGLDRPERHGSRTGDLRFQGVAERGKVQPEHNPAVALCGNKAINQ